MFFKNLFYYLYRYKILRKFIRNIVLKRDGGMTESRLIRRIYKDYHSVDIGMYSYGGCFDLKQIHSRLKIGKFCSFASNVYFFNANHPKEFVSTHPFFYNTVYKWTKNEMIDRVNQEVGNDVWIGQNAIILPSARKIGDGAIVGANSVVTRDVPDYAIVVGSPAKIIGYRFNDDDIQRLRKIKWWDWSVEKIYNNKEKFYDQKIFFEEFITVSKDSSI